MMTNQASMIYEINKSGTCLVNALDAFIKGDVESAIRCLNITFKHATNTDWSVADTIKILVYLSRLYFYEGRFDKATVMLESAVEACRNVPGSEHKFLSHLHYNLAECYLRTGRIEACKKNFLIALDLIAKTLGRNSKSYGLIHQRFLGVHNFRSDLEQSNRLSVQLVTLEDRSRDQRLTQSQFETLNLPAERNLELVAF